MCIFNFFNLKKIYTTKMIFQSIENILVLGTVFIIHRLLRNKPGLLYLLTGVPFLKLIKKDEVKEDKKLTKKLKLQAHQTLESYEKGILIGNYQDMQDVHHIEDFSQIQFIFLGLTFIFLIKNILFAVTLIAGPQVQNPVINHIRSYLIKHNFMNYILLFIIVAFKIKIVNFIWKKGKIFSSESKSAILLLAVFIVPVFLYTTLYVHKISSEFNSSWLSLRTSLQILFPNSGWFVNNEDLIAKPQNNMSSKGNLLAKMRKEQYYTPLNIPLFVLCVINIYILSPALLKFSKTFNLVMQSITKDDQKLERLAGNSIINEKEIEEVVNINKINKKRRMWFLLTLITEMVWLLLLSFDKISLFNLNLLNGDQIETTVSSKDDSVSQKHKFSYISIVIFGSVNIVVGLLSFRKEIKTKYTAVFQQLLDYRPKTDVYHSIYKVQVDNVYLDSLRDAILMISKSLLPLLYIFLVSGLLSRVILIDQLRGSKVTNATDKYVDNLLYLTNTSSFLRTRVTQYYRDIFSVNCPLLKGNIVGQKIGLGYGVIPAESMITKIENQAFGKIVDYLMIKGVPLAVEFLRILIVVTGWVKVFGEIIWTFYLSKVEQV